MKVLVTITLKNGVLDPQGKAIQNALDHLGFDGVQNVRQGKVIELDLAEEATEESVKHMCEKLLANPVIEDYRIEFPETAATKTG